MRKVPLRDRFFEKVQKESGDDGCWLWTASKYRDGYGRIQFKRKSVRAHRISWLIHFGAVPCGTQVLHRCDTPLCVNPAHLFLGTHQDNMSDKVAKGRQHHPDGEANNGAKLTSAQAARVRELYIGGGWTYKALAERFGVSHSAISHIVKEKNWNSLETPPEYSSSAEKARRLLRVRGERVASSKLAEDDIIEIRRLRSRGHRLKDIADQFGISDVLVSLIARRKYWAHVE